MDPLRFDQWTRTLVVAGSRRHLLKVLTGGLVGGVAGLVAARSSRRAAGAPLACDRGACEQTVAGLYRICNDNCNSAFCRGNDRDHKECIACLSACTVAQQLG